MPSISIPKVNLIVVGGGAAGFMAAITAAEGGASSVIVIEGTLNVLEKVRISGGGRCNVTHACWNPKDLIDNYPRGRISLLGSFSRFAAFDTVSWFKEHGIELLTEEDGRMFPKSNSSSSIVRCLKQAADSFGIKILTKSFVKTVHNEKNQGFVIGCKDGSIFLSKRIVLATGGHPSGFRLASDLGHNIISPVPSLFTFSLHSKPILSCSGLAIDNVNLKLLCDGEVFDGFGRVLLTHWGLSGPAVLRMSAFAARTLYSTNYEGELHINWLADLNSELVLKKIKEMRYKCGARTLGAVKPFSKIPKRFWVSMLQSASIDSSLTWANCSAKLEKKIFDIFVSARYLVHGRGPFGEEFVKAGGVDLNEVNLATMESRLHSGLYFVGELLDVDGITGGFNFQHCWTSGWLAGQAIANAKFD